MQNNIQEQEKQNYTLDNTRFEVKTIFNENGKEVKEIVKNMILQSKALQKE